MRKAAGVLIVTDIHGDVEKTKTFTCSHCGVPRRLSDQSRGWCDQCDALVCADKICACECTPFKRKLDVAEARDRLRRAL